MPWKETNPMTEKERFVTLVQTGRFTITELCTDFGISRKTGHKYLQRYEAEGRAGLNERSRRPKVCPAMTGEAVEQLILKQALMGSVHASSHFLGLALQSGLGT